MNDAGRGLDQTRRLHSVNIWLALPRLDATLCRPERLVGLVSPRIAADVAVGSHPNTTLTGGHQTLTSSWLSCRCYVMFRFRMSVDGVVITGRAPSVTAWELHEGVPVEGLSAALSGRTMLWCSYKLKKHLGSLF